MRNRTTAIIVLALWTSANATHATAQEIDHSQHKHESATPVQANTGDTTSEHVPPDPPQHDMGDMPYRKMVELMQMDDKAATSRVVIDRLEWQQAKSSDVAEWDATLWYGGDFNKAMLKTEGERVDGSTEHARIEVLWDRAYSRWWNTRFGARQDIDNGPSRTWAAIGMEGLAPYWFDVEAMVYVGNSGRTALRVDVDYDQLLTQRLILRAAVEANVYGKDDRERQLGSGLSSIAASLRLRYEVHRQFAPYVGIAWHKKFARTADYAAVAGQEVSEAKWVAGLRMWF